MSTLVLGQEIQHKDDTFLVVRIVESLALFENLDGTCTKVEETYAELRSQKGTVEFLGIFEKEEPFDSKRSTIKALPLMPWRMK